MRSILIITIAMCISSASLAQKNNVKSVFHSQEQVAMINGNGAVSAGIQSVNGFTINKWFAGVGVGLDFYRYRSVPVFVDVKRYFNIHNKNAFFIYGDGGYNIPWVKKEDDQLSIWNWPSKTEIQYKGGAYMDAGAGYAIHCKRGNALLLSLGYSHKYFREKKTIIYTTVGDEVMRTDIQRFTYNFNRIMIKVGWQF